MSLHLLRAFELCAGDPGQAAGEAANKAKNAAPDLSVGLFDRAQKSLNQAGQEVTHSMGAGCSLQSAVHLHVCIIAGRCPCPCFTAGIDHAACSCLAILHACLRSPGVCKRSCTAYCASHTLHLCPPVLSSCMHSFSKSMHAPTLLLMT